MPRYRGRFNGFFLFAFARCIVFFSPHATAFTIVFVKLVKIHQLIISNSKLLFCTTTHKHNTRTSLITESQQTPLTPSLARCVSQICSSLPYLGSSRHAPLRLTSCRPLSSSSSTRSSVPALHVSVLSIAMYRRLFLPLLPNSIPSQWCLYIPPGRLVRLLHIGQVALVCLIDTLSQCD